MLFSIAVTDNCASIAPNAYFLIIVTYEKMQASFDTDCYEQS